MIRWLVTIIKNVLEAVTVRKTHVTRLASQSTRHTGHRTRHVNLITCMNCDKYVHFVMNTFHTVPHVYSSIRPPECALKQQLTACFCQRALQCHLAVRQLTSIMVEASWNLFLPRLVLPTLWASRHRLPVSPILRGVARDGAIFRGVARSRSSVIRSHTKQIPNTKIENCRRNEYSRRIPLSEVD